MTNSAKQLYGFLESFVYLNPKATIEEIESKATALRQVAPVTDEEFTNCLKKIKATIGVVISDGMSLVDDTRYNKEDREWYSKFQSESDNSRLANEYKKYLLHKKGWSAKVVDRIDKNSTEIMNLLGDPYHKNSFSRRGLVLGEVQSGKTANFTAICNKAADAGYRVIIIASGIIEKLRKQTQLRLDNEFVKLAIHKRIQIPTMTYMEKDFSSASLGSNQNPINTFTADRPVLFVIKKNVSILRNLANWLNTDLNKSLSGKIDFPLLFIDDEADNASINTNNDELDPTKTNQYIREILNMFSRSSYLAVTATPFANIFIDPDTESEAIGDDLFPRDFVYVLPSPSNYIGVGDVFGANQSTFVEKFNDLEVALPRSHKKDYRLQEIPESLKQAIGYFCLANVVRDLRDESSNTHRSMLIHISHYVNIHSQIKEAVSALLATFKTKIKNYQKHPDAEKVPEIAYLHQLWNVENLRAKTGKSWVSVLANHLYDAIADIEVTEANAQNHSLDYEANTSTGLRVIVVGGNSLSRGLTLEGLMVSYFRRNTPMCDTLLQMGRWFGYREGYRDLCRICLPQTACDFFGFSTGIYMELISDLRHMINLKKTPQDFGLKVRKHPGAMLPTARNKMRCSQEVIRPIELAGHAIETPRLIWDGNDLEENADRTREFIRKIGMTRAFTETRGCHICHSVASAVVGEFVGSFKAGSLNYGFDINTISEYILQKSELWDIAVVASGSGKEEHVDFGKKIVIIETSKRHTEFEGAEIHISGSKLKVATGGIMRVGLSDATIQKIEEDFKREHPNTELPDSEYLRVERPPILLIHLIEPIINVEPRIDLPHVFFALSIGFPGTRAQSWTLVYHLNKVAIAQSQIQLVNESDDNI
jgi:vacuolar-type H+-ATPase subunit F/Vma7